MEQTIAIPQAKHNNSNSTYSNTEDQFCELMKEIKYAQKKLRDKKWNLADYWYHLADFSDFIGKPADAEENRDKAKFWIQGVPEKGVRKTGYVNVGRRDVGIIKSIADCK